MSTPLPHAAPRARLADLAGRGLMAGNALLTLAVFVNGLWLMTEAADDRLMVEGWRTFGYLMFSAMWALLALWPRRMPAVWELVLLHKVAATILGLALLHTAEGVQASIADSWLVASTGFAYVACRGWRSWRLIRRDPRARRGLAPSTVR